MSTTPPRVDLGSLQIETIPAEDPVENTLHSMGIPYVCPEKVVTYQKRKEQFERTKISPFWARYYKTTCFLGWVFKANFACLILAVGAGILCSFLKDLNVITSHGLPFYIPTYGAIALLNLGTCVLCCTVFSQAINVSFTRWVTFTLTQWQKSALSWSTPDILHTRVTAIQRQYPEATFHIERFQVDPFAYCMINGRKYYFCYWDAPGFEP